MKAFILVFRFLEIVLKTFDSVNNCYRLVFYTSSLLIPEEVGLYKFLNQIHTKIGKKFS